MQLRLFAPILPFVTEEVWSWWRDGSVHRRPWPRTEEFPAGGADARLLTLVGSALSAVRGEKSARKLSMRTELDRVKVRGPAADLDLLASAGDDLAAAGRIRTLDLAPDPDADGLAVTVRLGEGDEQNGQNVSH